MSEEVALADANLREIERLRGLLTASQERERIAAEAYNQPQSSYRELEGLYQAAIEDKLAATADNTYLICEVRRLRDLRRVGLYGTAKLDEQALLNEWHPGGALLTALRTFAAVYIDDGTPLQQECWAAVKALLSLPQSTKEGE